MTTHKIRFRIILKDSIYVIQKPYLFLFWKNYKAFLYLEEALVFMANELRNNFKHK